MQKAQALEEISINLRKNCWDLGVLSAVYQGKYECQDRVASRTRYWASRPGSPNHQESERPAVVATVDSDRPR